MKRIVAQKKQQPSHRSTGRLLRSGSSLTVLLTASLIVVLAAMVPAATISAQGSGSSQSAPDLGFPPGTPSVTEVGKYLVISMGDDGDVGRAFQMSNTEIGADRRVLSTPSDPGCPTDGGFPNLLNVFGGDTPPRWNLSTNPDSMNGAEFLFQGTDWSGEVALTSNNGKFDSSNSLVFADIGIQSTASNPTTGGPSISNSYHFDLSENAPCSNADPLVLNDGATGNNNFTPLLSELSAWKTYIQGLSAELTINSNSAFQNNEASNGNGGLRTNYDGNDTNNDGVVVIDVNSNSSLGDWNLVNLDWVIDGSGSKVIIFRLRNGSNMIMNEVSITLGNGGIADNGIGVIFYSGYDGNSGDTVFNTGSSLVANGVGFWDLNFVGEGGGNVKTNINFNNAQGCAQFISQKVNFQNNRWNRCAPAAPALDFGDLPDTTGGTGAGNYQTLLANNGPRHTITGPRLGAAVDGEANGQQSPNADGDDLNGATPDDEDGVTIPALSVGETATVVVNSSAAGKLNAFFDWNNDGDFDDAGEVIAELTVAAGNNNLSVSVPADAVAGTPVGARFRVSTAGGLGPMGAAPDGEVEDYLVTVRKITITAMPYCLKDAPWVEYTVTAIGFTPGLATIEWIGSDNGVVQTLTNQPLSGDLLWPESAVDGSGYGTEWPGWDFVGGQWVEIPTTVRPQAKVRITVNPTAEAAVIYPPGTPDCAAGPNVSLGNLVFVDANVNGMFDTGDTGIDDVVVELWSPGADGMIGGGDDVLVDWDPVTPGVQSTQTTAGGGWYLFPRVPSGKYYTKIQASEFGGGGTLYRYVSTPGAGADDVSDQQVDENGVDDPNPALNGIVSNVVDLQATYEVSGEIGPLTGQADPSDNLTLDFGVVLVVDYGDAPDTGIGTDVGNYNTLSNDDGPSHLIVSGLSLGNEGPDADNGTLESAGATADDDNNTDDEDAVPDGLVFLETEEPQTTVDVTNDLGSPAYLQCWLDLDLDGDFTDSGEASGVTTVPANAGSVQYLVSFATPPETGTERTTYLRCRLSQTQSEVFDPTGDATSGEIEDHVVTIQPGSFDTGPRDWGDLPASYPTLQTANGARHKTSSVLYLGACLDTETNGAPSAAATGDDQAAGAQQYGACSGPDDEDGVIKAAGLGLGGAWTPGNVSDNKGGALTITIGGTGSGVPQVFMDFGGGLVPVQLFGPSPSTGAYTGTPLAPGTYTFYFDIPAGTNVQNNIAIRVRLSSTGGYGRSGLAPTGEVEDYLFKEVPLAVSLAAFEATAQGNRVLVTWETVSEVDNVGFNLYRATARDGERDLLGYVPAQAPGSPSGASYSFEDGDVQSGQTYWYWLEDIDTSGATTLHGPVSVDFQAPTAVSLSGLTAAGAAAGFSWPVVAAGLAAAVLAAGYGLRRALAG